MTTTTVDTSVLAVTGGRPLSGRVRVQGSKNVALHLYAAALLADEPIDLTNVPDILDTGVCARLISHTGTIARVRNGRMSVRPGTAFHPRIHLVWGTKVRTTAVLAAAALARAGQVTFPHPGGDAFCARLIDRHLAAMRAAGAAVTDTGSHIRAVCRTGGVRPFCVDVNTPYGPSLGATVTAMLLASRAPGTSLITRPSVEPEVVETGRMLTDLGAAVAWDGEGLHVTGCDTMTGGVIPVPGDRIEAATLVMAAAATGGSVTLDGISLDDFPAGLRDVLTRAGITLASASGGAVRATCGPLSAVTAHTGPHPGFPTDAAPQLAALLTQAAGHSVVTERVYPSRDTHVPGLRQFGVDITSGGPRIHVRGPARLHAADVEAADIRAVTSLVIAALAAPGTSTIRGMYHLRRGYGRLLPTLAALGADLSLDHTKVSP